MEANRKSKLAASVAAAGILFLGIFLLSAYADELNSAPTVSSGDLRSKALAATQQGHPELALPMYDVLIGQSPIDPQVFQEAHLAAMRAHDFQRAAAYGERQLSVDPKNFSTMEQIAFSYHMAGDGRNFEKARERARQYRLSTTDPKIISNRLMFDYFKAGNALVFANQCYRAAPPLRIKYRFDVMDPAPNAPGGQVLRAFLVLENPEADDKVAQELTGDTRPHFSLDAFENNRTIHKTIQPFIGEPPYETVKARVAQYLQDGAIISSSTAPTGRSFNGDCSPIQVPD